jgi:hypothetical protein
LERGQRHASTKTKGSVVVNAKDHRPEVDRAQDYRTQDDRAQDCGTQVDSSQEHGCKAATAHRCSPALSVDESLVKNNARLT